MLLLLALAAVAGGTVPAPMSQPKSVHEEKWVSADDYPPDALRETRHGITVARLVVTPAGSPQSCLVVSSGYSDFDDFTCAILMKRSHFVPATDDKGEPVYSVYKARFIWKIPQTSFKPPEQTPDVDLTVSRLPAGLGPHVKVDVSVLFDENGQIIKCAPEPDKAPSALVAVACDQALTYPKQAPVLDATGKPVKWLTELTFGFSVATEPPHPN